MDRSVTDAGPVVVAANWYAFRPGERIRHDRVMSVCLLWVLAGGGTVRSRGERSTLGPGSVLRLPWAHDVEYVADARAPFRLGTVHVVPRHDRAVPVEPRVAHLPGDPLFDDPARADVAAGSGDGNGGLDRPVLVGPATGTARRVDLLGRYAVERFVEGSFDEAVFRSLGEVLLAEVPPRGDHSPQERSVPAALERMTAFVADRLDWPVSVAEVAAAGDCSASTAERLFVRHLGSSVSAWVRAARMRQASSLLRTTGLRVGEVARAVGYADPLYFSRVFRGVFGVPPTQYAASRIRP